MRTDLRNAMTKALKLSKDNPAMAIDYLIKMAAKDHKMRGILIDLGAKQTVRDFYAAQRISAMSMASGRVKANINNPDVELRITGRMARLLFWESYTIYGMKPIGDATKEELIESAKNREAQASGELRMAKFERAVASKLRNGQTVKKSITLDEVMKLAKRYGAKND